ncbi:MAG: UbiD family decarboxylase [Candidatus Bathyarchaeia archaeon]
MVKDLRTFINKLESEAPEEIIKVDKEVDPKFEITAILQHLEDKNCFPAVLFNRVKNAKGESSQFKLITNIFASRKKCALALDLPKDKWRMEVPLRYAERQKTLIKPIIIDRKKAPCKEVIKVGEDLDIRDLPVVTHHEMDGQPYFTTAVVAADPENPDIYNVSHHRMLVKGKDITGIYMSPRHLWNYYVRAEKEGKPLPIAQVVGHHPAFYLGAEKLVGEGGMSISEYEIIGGILGEPLRLVPSETYGEKLLIPADAEIIIEGEILPKIREAEGPFGEYTGYYGPQRWSPVVRVKAITHRKDAIYLDIFIGHPDAALLGGIPKEAGVYSQVKAAVPTVKATHFPISGCCRFHCYISIDKQVEGEGRVAALAAFPLFDELKHVVVVDSDIDVFNEREVLWAIATRVQADEALDIIRHTRGGTLDPSQIHNTKGSKLIIDATKPLDRPFEEKLRVPQEVMQRIDIKKYIRKKDIKKLGVE